VAQIQEQPTTSQALTKEKRKMPEHTTKGKEVLPINETHWTHWTLDEEDDEEDEFQTEDENDILERAVVIYDAKNNETA
jgi:hypothetical protein